MSFYTYLVIEQNNGINPERPDASFDLDGTVFKMTVLEVYTDWLSKQTIFDPMPADVIRAKQSWKEDNTEQKYVEHMGKLVRFFVEQIPGKSVNQLTEAAHIVANQQKHRRWNVTTSIVEKLRHTHNVISVSHMPEWLMEPFARDLGFVALIGSIYVAQNELYTDEAHSIDKATEYAKIRDGDTSMLDIHMGDTVGDSSLFDLASRPILFNPSYTLLSKDTSGSRTIITSHKDVVSVMSPGENPSHKSTTIWGPPLKVEAILNQVARVK